MFLVGTRFISFHIPSTKRTSSGLVQFACSDSQGLSTATVLPWAGPFSKAQRRAGRARGSFGISQAQYQWMMHAGSGVGADTVDPKVELVFLPRKDVDHLQITELVVG